MMKFKNKKKIPMIQIKYLVHNLKLTWIISNKSKKKNQKKNKKILIWLKTIKKNKRNLVKNKFLIILKVNLKIRSLIKKYEKKF